MGFLSSIFEKPASPDSVTFDVSRYEYQGTRDGAKVWHTPEGDGLGSYFLNRRPDIPAALTDITQLREYYSSLIGDTFRVIECQVRPFDEISGVRLIVGGPDPKTGGAVYVGSLTIPFRDFSYVIKIQTCECGVTGMRETLLVAQALKNGTGSVQDGRFVPQGWSFDDEQFDSLVPKHPLSLLRRELRQIAESLRVDAAVKRKPSFDLPDKVM